MQNTFYFWFQKTKKFLHMHNNNVYLSSQTIWIESAFNLLSRLQFELHRNHQTSKGEHSEPNFAEITLIKYKYVKWGISKTGIWLFLD